MHRRTPLDRTRVSIIRFTVFALLFLFATPSGFGQFLSDSLEPYNKPSPKTIRSISYAGKFKLHRSILSREIDSRVGATFRDELLERDRRKIDGLGIFSNVGTRVTEEADSVDIVFDLAEMWTLTPLASIGTTDHSLDWMVGAHERDFFGTLCSVLGYFRRFEGENSYVLDLVFPRTLGRDLQIGLNLAHDQEKDIATFDGIETTYRYLRKYIGIGVGFRVSEIVYPSMSFGYSRENWKLLSQEDAPVEAPQELDYPRYSIGAALGLGRVYSDHFYYDGLQLTTSVSFMRELPGSRFNRWRLHLTSSGYAIVGGTNLCGRLQFATSSADERVPPYAISGNSNVRGYRDKYDRGDRILGGNAEVRRKLIETRRWYSQAALFVDAAALWGRQRRASDALSHPYWSFGGGLRLAFKKWPRLGRADVIFNTSSRSWTYYISSSQFF